MSWHSRRAIALAAAEATAPTRDGEESDAAGRPTLGAREVESHSESAPGTTESRTERAQRIFSRCFSYSTVHLRMLLTNLFTRTCTARARERRAMANTPGSQLDDATPIASRSSACRRPLRFRHTRSAASGSIDADRSLACARRFPVHFIVIHRSAH